MKKILLIFTALFCFVLLCSCGKINGIPEGEYALCIDDKDGLLAEPLKESYKPGEIITVKVHVVCDANAVATMNGKKGTYKGFGNGVTVYEFTMPEQTSLLKLEISGGGFFDPYYHMTVNDPYNVVTNDLTSDAYYAQDKVIIKSQRNDLIFETTPAVGISGPELVKNGNGGFSHYEYSFKMPSGDLTVNVDLSMYEPTLWSFTFNNHTGIENLFTTEFMEEYAEGEVIEINVNPDALIEDRGIILKANGVLIEGKNEWCVLMTSKELKIDAYLINAPFGENWKYLNVIDKNGLLAQAADGYYQIGNRVVIYTDYLIDIIFEDGVQINGLCVDEGEGVTEYIYSFEMPDSDLTIEISNRK